MTIEKISTNQANEIQKLQEQKLELRILLTNLANSAAANAVSYKLLEKRP